MLNRLLQGLVEMLVHLHDSRLIAAAVTIVGSRKYRHHVHIYIYDKSVIMDVYVCMGIKKKLLSMKVNPLTVGPVESIHYKLVRSGYLGKVR